MIKLLAAAFAVSAASALPASTQSSATPQPVACRTEHDLFAFLNAADRRDVKEEARLSAGACLPLAGLGYEIVGDGNGIATIRVFPRAGDWASSRLAVTLEEMVAPY